MLSLSRAVRRQPLSARPLAERSRLVRVRDAGVHGILELCGLCVIIALAVIILINTNFGSKIATGITAQITKVTGATGPGAATPPADPPR